MATTTSDLAALIRTACVLEASARKPGNVHPDAEFPDLSYRDFVVSAEAVAVPLSRAAEQGVGQAVLTAIEQTQNRVGKNVNLGIVLLLAPLAAVPRQVPLQVGIREVLQSLSHTDAVLVYRAIRLARPGGMGRVSEQDIADDPEGTLLDVMKLAAERDSIAAQYVQDFSLVLKTGVGYLADCSDFTETWESSIIGLALSIQAEYPDSLIARKCGWETAVLASRQAREILKAGWPHATHSRQMIEDFDRWLRGDGNRRNPGTTADLVTASLFAALRENVIMAPQITSNTGN